MTKPGRQWQVKHGDRKYTIWRNRLHPSIFQFTEDKGGKPPLRSASALTISTRRSSKKNPVGVQASQAPFVANQVRGRGWRPALVEITGEDEQDEKGVERKFAIVRKGIMLRVIPVGGAGRMDEGHAA